MDTKISNHELKQGEQKEQLFFFKSSELNYS